MFELLVQPATAGIAFTAWAAGVASMCALNRYESRRHYRAARVLAAAARVPVADRDDSWAESKPSARPAARPLEAETPQKRLETARPPPSLAPPESTRPESKPAPVLISTAVLRMGATHQVAEFLADVRNHELGKNPFSGRWELIRSDKGWIEAYQAWAGRRRIMAMPEDVFLRLLSKAAGIKKSRDRLKDPATCRVLKNERGTPLRATYYTVYELVEEVQPQRVRRAA